MSETTTAPTVAQATAEALAAEQEAAELRAAVENGDDSVTPAALAEAEQKGIFARLRIKAAKKRAAEQAEADRHKRAKATAADIRALIEQDDTDDIAAKVTAAVDALTALYSTTEARRLRVLEMAGRVQPIAAELERAGFHPITELRERYAVAAGHDSVTIYTPHPVGTVGVTGALAVAAVVGMAVRDAREQAKITDQMGYLSSRVETFIAQVPALRAVFNENGTAK
ncbi:MULTISPECIES: hypothetical protein [Streptomyces]|uniref:Uncharacterized protein n=1 Tax=Streptomyces dengpaensis TaxID=2049881 RepID=A0ABN5I9P0_9ACTN|nr:MULTISPECIES: hypothetical protein [Streptomyces]AVH59721.1 hypothetical protein C4B68_32655 [Streptomyces dengpaensis]PIB09365.1 hypothetical protein B1C81_09335 [Streptomyces sp. HG99]